MTLLKFWRGAFLCVVLWGMGACSTTHQSGDPSTSVLPAGSAHGENIYDAYMEEERKWVGLTSKRVRVRDGLEIAYSEGGNLNAPVLILLHGFYGDRNNWNRVAYQLHDQYHLIIPDLPGHGDSSPHPDANYTFSETTFVLSEFVDQLHIQHFHLAGHSMGGGIAIQWIMSRSAQIDSLTLIDSAGKYSNNASPIMQDLQSGRTPMRIAEPGDAEKMLSIAMAMPPFVPADVMKDFERKQLKRTAIYDKVMADMLARDKTLDVRFFNTALKLFNKPTLVIWGDQDSIFSVNVTEQLMSVLSKGTLVVIKGVGHTPMLEAPWPVTEAIKTFLTSNFGGG